MSDQDALLASILDSPKDDTPRLVYADWLDDHDQPVRAEFIRVQCEEATFSRSEVKQDLNQSEQASRRELRSRERVLLKKLRHQLLAEAGPLH